MEEEFIKEEENQEQEINRQYYQRELRSLELIAYAELLSAVRASGALDDGKRNIINFVREAFRISDERHKAEVRRVASDERLGLIADMVNGTSTSQGWADEGFTHFPTLPHIVKYIKDQPPDELDDGYERVNQMVKYEDIDESEIPDKNFFENWIREPNPRFFAEKPKGGDFTEFSIKSESESSTSQSSQSSESSSSEDEMPAMRSTIKRRGPVKRKVTNVSKNKLQAASSGRGNPSPDITDTPVTPTKREINRSPAKRGRGAKRKLSTGNRTTIVSKPIHKPSGRGKAVKNLNNPRPIVERTSSGETPDEDVPIKRTKPSDGEFNSVPVRGGGRGRGLGRIRGGRGIGMSRGMGMSRGGGRGGRGRGAKRETRPGSPEKASIVASKLKIKLNRPLKSKIKKPVIPSPVGSRRKSKLKEKPIDDLIVEMRNYDDHVGRSYIQTEMSMKKMSSNDNIVNDYSKMESDSDSTQKENLRFSEDIEERETSNKYRNNDGEDISSSADKAKEDSESKDSNNEEDRPIQNDKDSSSNKSDSENSCSSFNKGGSRHSSPPVANQLSVSSEPFSEVVIASSGSNSNSNHSSSSSSSADDNEENVNSSDTEVPESKSNVGNSQTQNQSSNSPIPLQSINSQQCTVPPRELPSPPPIHKPIRHKIPAGVNPSPGVIIQQPRNPLPAPVFSTSLNMSSFHKKRTKLIGNNVDGYNLHLPPGNSTSGVTTTVATASSLATRRPTIISAAGVGGIYSNSSVLTPSGRSPGILHQARKAHPHILSTSKAHRNFIPNSNSNTNSLNTNNISLSTQSQSINVTSVSTNCISSVTNSAQVQPNQNFTSATASTISTISSLQQTSNTTPVSGQNFPTQSGSTLSMANAIPLGSVGVARSQGTNIIFLQKATSSTSTGNPTTLSTNVLPVKNSPRAVILRRAQIPRQGNVMILDVQKNQLVNASQVPQFLQTARILSATNPELSVLNLPGNQAARKIIQAPSSVSSSPPSATTITYPAASSIGLESPFRQPGVQTQIGVQTPLVKKARIFSQQSVVSSTASTVLPTTTPTALRNALTGGSSNPAVISSTTPNCLSSSGTTHIVIQRKEPTTGKTQPIVDGLVSSTLSNSKISGNKSQCPIEAELMEMERNDMLEEEVATTSEVDSTISNSAVLGVAKGKATSTAQFSNNNKLEDINSQHLGFNKLDTSLRLSSSSATSASNTSMTTPVKNSNNEGSSTDTASENESSFSHPLQLEETKNAKQKPITELSNVYNSNSSPLISASISINSRPSSGSVVKSDVPPRAVNQESIQCTPITEDIFEAALKSSGIIFNENNPYFDNEEELSTNSFLADMDSSQDLEVASQVEVITLAESAE